MLKLPTRQTAHPDAKTLWKNANLKVRDFLNSMCFSGPSFLGMLIFYLVPFGVVIYYSFIAGVVDNSFVGLKNYIAVFDNAAFRTAAKNTAVFTGLAVPLAVVLFILIILHPYAPKVLNNVGFAYLTVACIDTTALATHLPQFFITFIVGSVLFNGVCVLLMKPAKALAVKSVQKENA